VTLGNGVVLECQAVFELGEIEISNSSCVVLQARGVDVCLCEGELPVINDNCTLCRDGSSLPMPTLEGLPDKSCAEIQLEAMRDDEENCAAYQNTVGGYCGCNVTSTPTDGVCRLCDPYNLPNPLDVDNSTSTMPLSCGEIELQANFPNTGGDCEALKDIYAEFCCRNVVVPTDPPTSGSSGGWMSTTAVILMIVAALYLC
jgi:hypothetical protein